VRRASFRTFHSKVRGVAADELHGNDPVDMQRDRDDCIEHPGSKFEAFWSNRLKNNQLSMDRFSDLERIELIRRLDRLADVRKAVVTRGKALVSDPHYPSPSVIRDVSKLLATKLTW
jgi:hypothetical protein